MITNFFIDSKVKQCIRECRFVAFDFDGVFTDNKVYVSENGSEMVCCWRGDGIGLRKLERLGMGIAIISSEINPVVTARSRKLGIRCIQGVENKLETLKTMARELHLTLSQIAFVGNDINDLECLRSVGFPIVVQDAHPDVIPSAQYQTKTPGGYGAVREICDLFEHVLEREA